MRPPRYGPASEAQEHPKYVERRQEWQDLKRSSASAALVKAAKTKMDVELARLRRVETKKLREDWIKTDGLRYLRMQQQDNAAEELSKGLNDYMLPPCRAAVTEMLFEASDQSQVLNGRLLPQPSDSPASPNTTNGQQTRRQTPSGGAISRPPPTDPWRRAPTSREEIAELG